MDATGVAPQGRGEGITAEFVWDYFRDVDTMDPDRVARYYDAAGTFRFGNAPPARGPDAVRALLVAFYGAIRGMRHRNTGLWLGDGSGVFEAEVTFTRPDGSVVTVPAVSILRVAPGAGGDPRVVDFRMTMDAAPVVAPAEGAAHVAADGPAEPHAHARAVALRFYDLLRGADPAPVDDVLAPAWVEYPPSAPGQAPGAAGFAPVLANFRATFPDLEAVVEDVLVDGDRVVVRSTLQGTHRGATYGLAPTGRRVAFMAIDIHRVAGERIAETWHVEDRLSLLTQLGALGGGGGTGGSARDAARGSDRGSDRDADRGADDAVRGEGAHV